MLKIWIVDRIQHQFNMYSGQIIECSSFITNAYLIVKPDFIPPKKDGGHILNIKYLFFNLHYSSFLVTIQRKR